MHDIMHPVYHTFAKLCTCVALLVSRWAIFEIFVGVRQFDSYCHVDAALDNVCSIPTQRMSHRGIPIHYFPILLHYSTVIIVAYRILTALGLFKKPTSFVVIIRLLCHHFTIL